MQNCCDRKILLLLKSIANIYKKKKTTTKWLRRTFYRSIGKAGDGKEGRKDSVVVNVYSVVIEEFQPRKSTHFKPTEID